MIPVPFEEGSSLAADEPAGAIVVRGRQGAAARRSLGAAPTSGELSGETAGERVVGRTPLHALRISVSHASSGARLVIGASIPDDVGRALALLKAVTAGPRAW